MFDIIESVKGKVMVNKGLYLTHIVNAALDKDYTTLEYLVKHYKKHTVTLSEADVKTAASIYYNNL